MKSLELLKMDEFHEEENRLGKGRINEVYVPRWAQTLIDLYISPLKDEVLREMRGK